MNKIERIRYHITGYNFSEITRGKGSIDYQLTDEFGNERTVTAIANLNVFKKISSVRPIYHRELPLIQALAQSKLNDSIIVDFSEFNKKHPRGSMRTHKTSIPAVRIKPVGTSNISYLSSLWDNKMRFIQLMILTVAGFMILSYFLAKVPSPLS